MPIRTLSCLLLHLFLFLVISTLNLALSSSCSLIFINPSSFFSPVDANTIDFFLEIPRIRYIWLCGTTRNLTATKFSLQKIRLSLPFDCCQITFSTAEPNVSYSLKFQKEISVVSIHRNFRTFFRSCFSHVFSLVMLCYVIMCVWVCVYHLNVKILIKIFSSPKWLCVFHFNNFGCLFFFINIYIYSINFFVIFFSFFFQFIDVLRVNNTQKQKTRIQEEEEDSE